VECKFDQKVKQKICVSISADDTMGFYPAADFVQKEAGNIKVFVSFEQAGFI